MASTGPHMRLRKDLTLPLEPPRWPSGIRPVAFAAVPPEQLHAVLTEAFPGAVAPLADWYGNLTHDDEFDPILCVPAVSDQGEVVGFAQCWTSNFIKDLAVSKAFRGQGIGAALMQHCFALFADRGAPHVDLKVELDELPARRLYARLGMTEVPL